MDVPVAWIALGAALGMLLLLGAGTVVLLLRPRPPAPGSGQPAPPAGDERDDLAGFLAHPPGTPGARDPAGDGWAPLAASTPRRSDRNEPAPPPRGTRPGAALASLAVVALLLIGTAAALAASARSPEGVADSPADPVPEPSAGAQPILPPGGDGVVARLAFDGVVLQEHAVGITAAYPQLELTVEGERVVADLLLPAANCLAVTAPPSAGDPSCRSARTEHARLSTPDLSVVRDGDQLTVSGRFATSWRPPGAPAEPTGRSYPLSVTVAPVGDARDGWLSADGRLDWDDQRARTRTDGPPSTVRASG